MFDHFAITPSAELRFGLYVSSVDTKIICRNKTRSKSHVELLYDRNRMDLILDSDIPQRAEVDQPMMVENAATSLCRSVTFRFLSDMALSGTQLIIDGRSYASCFFLRTEGQNQSKFRKDARLPRVSMFANDHISLDLYQFLAIHETNRPELLFIYLCFASLSCAISR